MNKNKNSNQSLKPLKPSNPFPKPETISELKNDEIKNLIKEIFEKHGSLNFHDMIKFFEKAIEDRDLEKSMISAFYCCNVVLGQHSIKDLEKNEIIRGIVSEVNNLSISNDE